MTANQLEQGHFHSYQYLITSVTASKSLQYIQSYTLQLPYPTHAKYHNFWYLQNTTSKKIFSNFLFLYFWVALCNELDFQPNFHAFFVNISTHAWRRRPKLFWNKIWIWLTWVAIVCNIPVSKFSISWRKCEFAQISFTRVNFKLYLLAGPRLFPT